MSKMTYKQIDHARARLATIERSLVGPAPTTVADPDFDEFVEALLDGTAVLTPAKFQTAIDEFLKARRKHSNYYNRPTIEKFIIAAVNATTRAKAEAVYAAEKATYDARNAVVSAEATKVEDQIVLGDQKAALAALQAFALLVV